MISSAPAKTPVHVVNGNIEVALRVVDDWHRPGGQIAQVRLWSRARSPSA